MLELKNISKFFPGVVALDDVSLEFEAGEIHALIGENGAGKSTLIKIICGILKADRGTMSIDGKEVVFKGFQDAINCGINFVSQEIMVFPEATVAENICMDKLGRFTKNSKLGWGEMREFAKKYLDYVGLDIDPMTIIGRLTPAEKQMIQIAKAISSGAKYILFDEPTSSLTKHEAEKLFRIMEELKKDGKGLIFVSHKLEEITAICDRVSVIRDGKYIGTRDCASITRPEMVKMMIGRDEAIAHRGFLNIQDEVVLEAKNIVKYGMFNDVGFKLHKGEILGWYGLVGSGRSELARLIIGEELIDGGQVYVNGEPVRIKSISDSIYKHKIAYVTENRKEEGLILDASIEDNITITIWNRLANKFRKINRKKEVEITDEMIDTIKIKCPSRDTAVLALSGGNQQKVSIGKWLAADCDILIIDEPTVGVDIGAKEYIHNLIWDLAKVQGKSIILISSDLPELLSLARRVLVFSDQQIKKEITGLNETERSYEELSAIIGDAMI